MGSKWLLRLVVAAVFLAQGSRAQAPAHAQANPRFVVDREVPAKLPVEGIVPIWSGRSLLGLEVNNRSQLLIYSIDRDGNREEIWFAIPDAGLIQVLTPLAGTQDGAIAVTGVAYGSDKAATFLAWIPPDRKQQIVTRIWPYCPDAITIAPNGTIWTVGRLKDEANLQAFDVQNIMRHYDHSGRMLGSWVVSPKRSLKRMPVNHTDGSRLVASRERVGWLSNAGEYIEYSPNGVELARCDGPAGVEDEEPRVSGVALSAENELFVGVFSDRPKGGASQVLALDRQTGTWQPAVADVKAWSFFAGLDGESPILLTALDVRGQVRRYKPNRVGQTQ